MYKPCLQQIIFTLIFSLVLINFLYPQARSEKLPVQISYKTVLEEHRIKALALPDLFEKKGEYIETRLTWDEIFKLHRQGFDVALVIEVKLTPIDSAYHNPGEVNDFLFKMEKQFSEILKIYQIGESTTLKKPILAINISDQLNKNEDEPAILLTAAHHGREPLSTEVCLYLIENLCQNYNKNDTITDWIQSTEIWIVPVVNPDGYEQVFGDDPELRYWRKNIRDNNQNEIFEAGIDGVDLNRNYEYNWNLCSDTLWSSEFYRGPAPFSESETYAIKKLCEQEQFTFVVDFHSSGETILYNGGLLTTPPDSGIINEIASELARRLRKQNKTENYDLLPLDEKTGQSSLWHYGELGSLSYLIECGDALFPPAKQIEEISKNISEAVYYLLNRLKMARLCGSIRDSYSSSPIPARINITDWKGFPLHEVYTEPFGGSFNKILLPGHYWIEVIASNYVSKELEVVIHPDKVTKVEIFLEKKITHATD